MEMIPFCKATALKAFFCSLHNNLLHDKTFSALAQPFKLTTGMS